MKRKRIVWWIITAAIFCLVVTMVIILVSRSRERGTSVELEPPTSEEKSAAISNNVAVSAFPDTADVTHNTIKQNQSVLVNQTNTSEVFGNFTDPEICVQQWIEDLMSAEDTLRCIDRYMATKDSQSS